MFSSTLQSAGRNSFNGVDKGIKLVIYSVVRYRTRGSVVKIQADYREAVN